jgi:hypothetical protein
VGITNSKPFGPIIVIGESKTGSNSHIIFITLFSSKQKHSFVAVLFNQPLSKLSKYAREKPFSRAKPAYD